MADIKSAIQAASNRAAGLLGRVIDVAGTKANAVGIKLPEKNISEKLEYQGSKSLTPEQRVTEVVSQGKSIAGQDTEVARNLGLNFTYDTSKGISGSKPAYNLAEQKSALSKPADSQFTMGELASLGLGDGQLWNGNEINIGGQKYRVKDNGNGTRSFEPISDAPADNSPKYSFQEGLDKAGGADLVGQYLNQGQVDELLKKYAEGQFGRADDLASEIERVARENAEREYGDVLSALKEQGKEVETLGGQQKERALKEKELIEAEMAAKQESELKDIDKQKMGFIEDDAEQRDQLGRAWKDMSLEVQRIMRGRGIADSSFATEKEIEVLKDFNAGLRQLAVKKSSALKDFADAVIETNSFYKRKGLELAEEVRQRVEDVDNWVRQQTTSIMQQERTALSKKLADINNAILKGRELKTNIAQQVAQTELNFGMWLKQTEINYKMAVAEAAKGKVASAGNTIKQAAELSKQMFTLLENGQAQWVKQKDGTYGLQDLMTGSMLPTRPGFKDEYEQLQEAKMNQKYWQGVPSTSKITGQYAQQALTGGMGNAEEDEEGTGLFGSIFNTSKK